MRNLFLATENYYHIYNRGVDKRQIFMDNADYLRFLHNMYEFNDKNFSLPYMNRLKGQTIGYQVPNSSKKRELIVKIHCFCLMPNHFHFILEPLIEGGISLFMQKLLGGYSRYFNLKYERSGTLMQGPFKAVYIKTDAQMMHLSRYIHILNPGELIEPQIREGIINNPSGLQEFLKNYKWSSYLDYIGGSNYPSLINKNLLAGYFSGPKDFEKFSLSWKNDDFEKIDDILID